jgi:hypothetical protein
MASWIVHLRIADNLLEHLPFLDAGQFAIGNVAPDSGVPDEKWETFDPPGEITHYQTPESSGKIKVIEDLRFYRDHLKDQVSLKDDPERFSFLLGYFFHLVTDNLWSARIARPTYERYRAEFDANPDFIWEVKKDWYGLDFTYVRSHPDSLFWTDFLTAQYDTEYLEHFPPGAIADKLTYIKEFYQRTDEQVKSSLRLSGNMYLNEAEMALFVDGAYRDLLRVYQLIFQHGEDHPELTSVMALI